MLYIQRRIENRKQTCISIFRDIYIYVFCIWDEHQFVPGFQAQRWMRSAFHLPADPLNTSTCAVQAFLRELTKVIAQGSIGSSAESLFTDDFLSSIEIWDLYTAKSVFNSSGTTPWHKCNLFCFWQLEDHEYKPLDPKDIRLPPPMPPSERLLAAVEAFYSPPSHDRPRNR